MSGEPVSIIETYRGIGIQADQPTERIETVVKPEIDRVLAEHDLEALYAFAKCVSHAPESRLLAAAKVEAVMALCAEDRRSLPQTTFDRDDLRAVAGPWLSHQDGRSRTHYCGTWEALLAGAGGSAAGAARGAARALKMRVTMSKIERFVAWRKRWAKGLVKAVEAAETGRARVPPPPFVAEEHSAIVAENALRHLVGEGWSRDDVIGLVELVIAEAS